MENKSIHIVVSSDNRYAKLAFVLIDSLLDNNTCFDNITIHLMSNGISDNALSLIQNNVLIKNRKLIVYDINDIESKLKVSVPNTISITSYSRLFLSSVLSVDIEKVIYMDVDAIVNGSLNELWQLDIGNNLVAGVIDDTSVYSKKAIGLLEDDPYVNAGFLLISLKNWRRCNLEEKMISYLLEHNGIVYHHDQGLINALCCGRKKVLPLKYNVTTNIYTFPYYHLSNEIKKYYSIEEYCFSKDNPVFIHFTSGVSGRPWMSGCKHPKTSLFLEMKNKTPWKNEVLEKDNRKFTLKLYSFLFYHTSFCIYRFVINLKKIIKPSDI